MTMVMTIDGDGKNRDCGVFVSPLFPFYCARALAGVQKLRIQAHVIGQRKIYSWRRIRFPQGATKIRVLFPSIESSTMIGSTSLDNF
jgi:hypothetical protein